MRLAIVTVLACAVWVLEGSRSEAQYSGGYGGGRPAARSRTMGPAPTQSRQTQQNPIQQNPIQQGRSAAAAQATQRSNQINQREVARGYDPAGRTGSTGQRIDYSTPGGAAAYGDKGGGYAAGVLGGQPTGVPAVGNQLNGQGGGQPGVQDGALGQAAPVNPKAAAAAQATARAHQLNQGTSGLALDQGSIGAPVGTGAPLGAQPGFNGNTQPITTQPGFDGTGLGTDPGLANGASVGGAANPLDDGSWRYRQHNGTWWYWNDDNQWMFHRNGRWNAYSGDPKVMPGTAVDRAVNPQLSYSPSSNRGRTQGRYDPRLDYRTDPRTPYSNQFRSNTPYQPRVTPGLKARLPDRRLENLQYNDLRDAYR